MRFQVSRSVLVCSVLSVAASTTRTTTEEVDSASKSNKVSVDDGDFDLEKMSKEELEAICTSRGFELVKEKSESGKLIEYSQQDFIEAAQQCLAIEAEMDEILRNDPGLLRDIEDEAEKMRSEQRRLEEEIAEMQVKLDKERIRAGEKVKAAFVKIEDEEKDSTEIEDKAGMQTIDNYPDDDVEIIDLDEEHQMGDNKTEALNKEELELSQVLSNTKSFFDSKEIISEFRDHVRNDVNNLLEIVFPKPVRDQLMGAMRPAIRIVQNAGINSYDMLKRYMKVVIDKNDQSEIPEKKIKT